MAIKNKETGKYEATYFHKASNAVLTGVGKTKQEAYDDLRKQRAKFVLIQTDKYITSPGMEEFESAKGTITRVPEQERVFYIYTRPDLVDFINQEFKREVSDEG